MKGMLGNRFSFGRLLAMMAKEFIQLRRDRTFEDDAGRKTMLQIFEMLSADPTHQPLVREYRRHLATLLN